MSVELCCLCLQCGEKHFKTRGACFLRSLCGPEMTHIKPNYGLLPLCCSQQNNIDQSTKGLPRECYGPFTAIELDSSLTVPVPEHVKTSQMINPSASNWKGRCSMDPWESIKPIWTPDGGERLVTNVANQRHTVLFSPLQSKF
ncbi:hypothetical protein ECG_04816 [Echinococcus granulosus]|uniref:Expressed conserved protein n=1 Tax=Echinococcus granulosus TaxID=6210 RepID=A0A068WGZ3_ECHGR|nr:hypothetical protein ECG_04816 [Echinococcus granulosus]CDS16868.1 hypothetical protein EgrG_000957500 [Echinococcus granulosus]